MSSVRRLIAATDGSCLGNPGPGGWAWVISDTVWQAGGHQRTTNNLMEMRGVYQLLSAVPRDIPLRIEADSQYVIQVFTEWISNWEARGWRTASKRAVANQDAIRLVQPLLVDRDIEWVHVYGHRGHVLNELADDKARAAAEAVKAGREPATAGSEEVSAYVESWRRESR